MKLFRTIVAALVLAKIVSDNRKSIQSEENSALLQSAIDTYKKNQDALKESLNQSGVIPGDNNSELSNVNVSFILRLGNLVGSKMKAQVTLVMTNKSKDLTYTLTRFKVQPYINGIFLGFDSAGGFDSGYPMGRVLRPGETIEITLPGVNQIILPSSSDRDSLRNLICNAAGKKLITSCPKITINNAVHANIEFYYQGIKGAGGLTRAVYYDIVGVLRYCGENFILSKETTNKENGNDYSGPGKPIR